MLKFTYLIQVLILSTVVFTSCSKDETPEPTEISTEYYFPPNNSEIWETQSIESLNWNTENINDLDDYLSQNGTRAFIILVDGKIVIEKYWGIQTNINQPFNKNSNWPWASASKSFVAFLVGIAQEKGHLNINQKTSTYLGEHWSNLTLDKENLITIKHHLSMTTGLDSNVPDPNCSAPECFQYSADAGSQWSYHNGAVFALNNVIQQATGKSTNDFSKENLEIAIGMEGNWVESNPGELLYRGTARDAARFGLLLLNQGKWEEQSILSDESYFSQMRNSSQNLNPSYGYLFWLNGKSSIMHPGYGLINSPLSNDAPSDLYAALGKNEQFINVVPSKNMVVIRLGDAPNSSLVERFLDGMWERINNVTN